MSNRTARRCRCRRLLPTLLLVSLACMAPAMAGSSRSSSTATAPTTDAGWASLEAILSDEAQNVLETMPLLEGQKAHGRVRVRLDPARNEYTLLFPRDYLAEGNGGSLEDIVSMVGNAVVEAAAPAVKLYGQKTLYDGRPLEYYFPEDFAQPSEARKPDTARSSPFKVAVFAGHGMYYHYSFKDWRAQRDPSNGILEDDITSDFSQHLSKALGELSGTRVLEPRGHDIEPHAPSGQPWWRISNRYWLQRAMPNRPDIWHSLPNASHALRERDEDIRSRPLFANDAGADASIHLHTNAHVSTSASGTRVFYHAGRRDDEKLAANILCYMGESLHNTETYRHWQVADKPDISTKLGENSLAQHPSVIVELGFHTNPEDAAVLRESSFKRLAAKGITKAWYLYSQGIYANEDKCTPLKILNIPDVEALYGEHQQIKVEYEGIPLSMIQVISSIKNCPANAPCWGFNGGGPKEGPVTLDISCPIPDLKEPLVLDVETKLMDFSGGSAPLYHHKVKCMPGGAEGPGPWRDLARRH